MRSGIRVSPLVAIGVERIFGLNLAWWRNRYPEYLPILREEVKEHVVSNVLDIPIVDADQKDLAFLLFA